MDGVVQWAAVICTAAVVCTLTEFLTPKGNMEKIVQYILGVFMLCAIVVPVAQTVFNFDLSFEKSQQDITQASSMADTAEQQTVSLGKTQIENMIISTLSGINVVPDKIVIDTDKTDDGSISIILVTVYVGQQYKNDIVTYSHRLR